jgi:hypothetical protein
MLFALANNGAGKYYPNSEEPLLRFLSLRITCSAWLLELHLSGRSGAELVLENSRPADCFAKN